MESRTVLDLFANRSLKARRAELHAGLDERGVLLDGEAGVGVEVAEDPAFALGDGFGAELLCGDLVAPLAEGALGELLDVALVDQGNGLAAGFKGVADGVADQALGAEDGDGLDADAGVEADFFLAAFEQVVVEEINETGGVIAAFFELDAGVDVLGVLAEDDDVDLLGMLHGAGHALVVLDGADAGVEVEKLAQGHVEGADAAADRRGERPFDGDAEIAGGGHGVVGEPGGELAEGFFAGEDFKPADGALAAVGFLYCAVEDALRGLPDVAAGTVAFDERDDGAIGDLKLAVGVLDRLAVFGERQPVIGGLHDDFWVPFYLIR